MTSSIDTSGRVASIVRDAIAAQRKSTTRSAPGAKAAGRKQEQAAGLNALVTRRIGAIAADDPDRERKVFRAFLEATLLAELGEQLVNDSRFSEMVDAVRDQMESDPQISAAVRQAVGLLVSPAV